MTRLQSFRAFIAAMNPSSDPRDAIKQGYYVDPHHGGVWSKLTRALELEPASTHLVLGGIGSGKTSELLRACAMLRSSLRESGDFVAYCDVSRHHDLRSPPRAGVLFALTSQFLVSAAKKNRKFSTKESEAKDAIRALTEFAEDSVDWVPDSPTGTSHRNRSHRTTGTTHRARAYGCANRESCSHRLPTSR